MVRFIVFPSAFGASIQARLPYKYVDVRAPCCGFLHPHTFHNNKSFFVVVVVRHPLASFACAERLYWVLELQVIKCLQEAYGLGPSPSIPWRSPQRLHQPIDSLLHRALELLVYFLFAFDLAIEIDFHHADHNRARVVRTHMAGTLVERNLQDAENILLG